MKRLILASTALALMSASAMAADLPARTMAPAPAPFVAAPPMFTWTGFYAGVNAGWVRTENRVYNRGTAGFDALVGPGTDAALTAGFPARFGSTNRNGFIGGVQAGYNQQFGMFVAGIEADINWLGNRRTNTSTAGTGLAGPGGLTAGGLSVATSSRTDWLGTARLRGGVAFDRFLVYGTGGLAFGAPNHSLSVVANGVGTIHTGSNDDWKAGWTAGAGVEFAFTNNVTMKAEYLYYDLGRTTVTATPTALGAGLPGTSASARFDNKGHIARVGLNWKF
jgi:outer membrane immunogenic protein